MAAELSRADVGVPRTAAHWRESSPGKNRIKGRRKPRDKENGWKVFKRTATSLTKSGLHRPELISGPGLQLLPQVYGLLYARPSSTICVSWATEDCLQASTPPASAYSNHFNPKTHYSTLQWFYLKGHSVTELMAYMLYFNYQLTYTHAQEFSVSTV